MISWPFDSLVSDDGEGNLTYDRAFNSANLRKIFHMLYTNGVALTEDSAALQVVPGSGMSVSVNAGMAIIEGAMGFQEEAAVISLEAANATYARIDTIVARLNTNLSGRSISLEVLTGTAAAAPAAPAITRAGNIYDLRLADINIPAGATAITASMITDTRLDAGCGVATARPEVLDTTAIFSQYQASLDEYMSFVRDCMDETIAGNLQNFVTQSLASKVDKTGDTLSGELKVVIPDGSNHAKMYTECRDANGNLLSAGALESSLSGNTGVYDYKNGRWVCRNDADGRPHIPVNPVVIYSTKTACTSAGTSRKYVSVPGLANWSIVAIHVSVHEHVQVLFFARGEAHERSLTDWPTAGKFRGAFLVDWANNRIGMRCLNAGTNNQYCHLVYFDYIYGVL